MGSFDLAVSLFSGLPADPPSDDFIMRNAMDAQEVAVGWWPGDAPAAAAFYAYAHPRHGGLDGAALARRPRWDSALGEYVWTGTTSAPPPTRAAAAGVRALGVPARL